MANGKQVLCPNPGCRCVLSGKLTKAEIRTLLAQANAAKRKTFGTGNPSKPRLCPHCRGEFGARELKEHMPACPANPRNMPRMADVAAIEEIGEAMES